MQLEVRTGTFRKADEQHEETESFCFTYNLLNYNKSLYSADEANVSSLLCHET